MDPLADGAPDAVRTIRLERTLAVLRTRFRPDVEPSAPVASPEVLASHVADAVRRRIEAEPDDERRMALANRVLALLQPDDDVPGSLNRTLAFTGSDAATVPRQLRPVGDDGGSRAESPSLATALRAELATADRVDLLCGFVRRDGVRLLDDPLNDVRRRGVPFRVITTACASERAAVDNLVRHFNAEVRIGYDAESARPHARAWLFHRSTGNDTAFVGSANLSRTALAEGMEWTLRLSGTATPELLRKFQDAFESYWTSGVFVPYDPACDASRLDVALARGSAPPAIGQPGLDVRPLPHQREALTALDVERDSHDRHRNLVIAPGGTGKTVLAALDYRRLRDRRDASLLCVAPTDAARDAALRTFRDTLGDEKFGAIFVAGKRPRRRHLFASIDGLTEHGIEELPCARFDVVIVDGFDNAATQAYARLLAHLRPQELLALTATPDDDVSHHFDGRSAYELRLCDAVAAGLLAPVHYYGVADGVDLSDVVWKLGAYDADDLDRRYTGDDARADVVLAALRERVPEMDTMRAVGWCVSDAHATYMARVACDAGIPAATGPEALRAGEARVLFTARDDVDVPDVDTVLLLWPSDNPARFLRQLGVGLRRAPGKAALTVIDFIGPQRPEFRFDLRYRALTGASRRALRRQVEQGFPALPSGSHAVLDADARRIVLANLDAPSRLSRGQLAAEVRSHGDLPLASYLHEADRELSDVYRNGGTWTFARRAAGFATTSGGPDEEMLLRRVAAFAHVDDAERATVYRRLVDVDGPRYGELTDREQRLARMLLFTVWPKRGFASYPAGLAHLRRHRAVCAEIAELVDVAVERARHVPAELDGELATVPLASHASYLREEILAALGYATLRRPPGGHTSGAAWCPAARTDALFVTPGAGEPVTSELFRWRPRHRLSTSSATGQRYLRHREQGSEVVLFLREMSIGDGAAPFRCLGRASYVEHDDEPVSITWRLHRPMPSELVTGW